MKRFKNILFLYKGQPEDTATLNRAVDLAQANDALLKIVYVIKRFQWQSEQLITTETDEDLQDILIEEWKSLLERMIYPVNKSGVKGESKVLLGADFIEIIREVINEKHDLVITTADAGNRIRSMSFGSTEMHLMRKCPCPVWIMKPGMQGKYRRILAAVDLAPDESKGNNLNMKIMELAVSMAETENSELHICHAWQLQGEDRLRAGFGKLTPDKIDLLVSATKKLHRSWLDKLLDNYSLHDFDHQVHFIKGDAGKLIPEIVNELQCDMIFMGTVSSAKTGGLLIGNTAERILNQVDCSVLTVKPDGFISPVSTGE